MHHAEQEMKCIPVHPISGNAQQFLEKERKKKYMIKIKIDLNTQIKSKCSFIMTGPNFVELHLHFRRRDCKTEFILSNLIFKKHQLVTIYLYHIINLLVPLLAHTLCPANNS